MYIAVISSASSISERKNEIRGANIFTWPLIPKYNASGFSNKGRSIISKHLWYTSRCKLRKASVVLIPESWTLGKNPKRTLASGEFQNEFGRLPSVRNTGCPEVFPSPSKVVAFELVLPFEISIFECSFVNYVQSDIRIGILKFECATRFEYLMWIRICHEIRIYQSDSNIPTRFEYLMWIRICYEIRIFQPDSNIPTRFECQFGNAFANHSKVKKK